MLERLKEAVRPYYLRWIHFRLHPERRPEAFRRCWTYPFQRFPAPAGAVEPGRGRPGVLLFPMIDWSQRIQRTQQLARAFARQGRACVYLNPHLGRQYESLHVFDPSPRIARLEENILEYHPRLPREPVFHARRLGAGESASLHRGFEALLAALAPAGAFQLVSLPLWMGVCLALRESHGYPIVYDCHDLLEGFGNVAPELVRDEAELMLRADRVLFSSEPLREHHLRRHPELASKALLVRNAGGLVAPESFGADARRRERPVVGYVGAIEAWFDVETMRQAATGNPDFDFVLVGRVENPAAAALASLPNVRLHGEVEHRELPGLLAGFDAAVIPFLLNDLTMATNPIKLYEYFAFGLPVVASPMPETLAFGKLVYHAASPGEFARQVRAAVLEADGETRERRMSIARGETWDERAKGIVEHIGLHLRPQRGNPS